jgi:hypothetical protein
MELGLLGHPTKYPYRPGRYRTRADTTNDGRQGTTVFGKQGELKMSVKIVTKEHQQTTSAPSAAPSTKQEKTIVRANANRRHTQSPSFFSIYANDVQVQTTPWDLRLIFGEITNVPTSKDPIVDIMQLGELRLSPQLAKKMTEVLLDQLSTYEANVGEIPLPKD